MATANPRWKILSDHVEHGGKRLRTNPDGDVRGMKLYLRLDTLTGRYVGGAPRGSV